MLLKHFTAALAAATALPAVAADCVQNTAIYTEKDNGYVLTFRPTKPWEGAANMMTVMDLAFPDGTHIWGSIFIPNGTAHNQAYFYTADCDLPTFDPAVDIDPTFGSSQEELAACQVYDGILLTLENDDIGSPLWHDGNAPAQTILFPDLGPVIRYSGLVLGPGDEPHEVFTLQGCTD
jgi:hypothetical protein